MSDKVQEFIQESLKKESDIWLGIAQEKTKLYPNESPRQIIIRTVIDHFEAKYPEVIEELDNEIKKKRELSKNEFAVDELTDMRRDVALPSGLETRINRAFVQQNWHRFLSNEIQKEYNELEWFIKEFPRFTIPQIY